MLSKVQPSPSTKSNHTFGLESFCYIDIKVRAPFFLGKSRCCPGQGWIRINHRFVIANFYDMQELLLNAAWQIFKFQRLSCRRVFHTHSLAKSRCRCHDMQHVSALYLSQTADSRLSYNPDFTPAFLPDYLHATKHHRSSWQHPCHQSPLIILAQRNPVIPS